MPVKQVLVCLGHTSGADPQSHDRADHLGCSLQEVVKETAKVWDLTILGPDAEDDDDASS